MRNRFSSLFKPWNLPLIRLWVYEALTRLAATYPEGFLLRTSMTLGRPQQKCQDSVARHWTGLDHYRTSASVCDATAMWLWRYLQKSQPRFIVEFGTGFSTFVIAAYAQEREMTEGQPIVVLSAEDNKKWYELQLNALSQLGLSDRVHLLYSTLETQTHRGRQVVGYGGIDDAVAQFGLGLKPDFVFVDGPLGLRYGGIGRRGSMLQSIQLVGEGGTILVHDALRSEEFGAIQEFHHDQILDFACVGIVPLWYGLAVCNVKGDKYD